MIEIFKQFHQLEREHWSVTYLEEGWRLDHHQNKTTVFLSVSSRWLCLTRPLVEESHAWQGQEMTPQVARYQKLLRRNEQMYLAKFAWDETIFSLCTEIPRETASPFLLSEILKGLTRYGTGDEPDSLRTRPQEIPDSSQRIVTNYFFSLHATGWIIKEEPRNHTWHLGYKSKNRVFDVFLRITRSWAYFQVPVLGVGIASVLQEGDLREQRAFLTYLLKLNHAWYLAKIGLSEQGQVLLLLETPVETLDFPYLRFLTHTIGVYLDRYGQEIQIMASLQKDQNLVSLLAGIEFEASP